MTVSTTKKVAYTGAGSAAVIAATIAFLPNWEGRDEVAKKDMIGTGHPITYCYGQTDEFGKVKVGTRFTKKECDEKLAESLPFYLTKIQACIKVALPAKTTASLLDAAYNAGSAAVCRSPMVAKMNAGDLRGGCDAFRGPKNPKTGEYDRPWYASSDGKVRKGLVARRVGIGDGRKSERDLCLEGVREGLPKQALVPIAPSDPHDPYACFGAGRYAAMAAGQICPPPKRWWQK